MSELTLQEALKALDERLRRLEQLPWPRVREEVFTALELIDRIHRPGVTRLASLLKEAGLFEQVNNDEAIGLLFELYDQFPLDERSRAEEAVEMVRPYLRAHGGDVEILEVREGEVHVRLLGACAGCAASALTLRLGVEEALKQALPGFRRLVVRPEPQSSLAPRFEPVASLNELPQRGPWAVEAKGRRILLVRLGSEVYGYQDVCPACGEDLARGWVEDRPEGPHLLCPRGCAFRLPGGPGPGGGLRVVPVSLAGDQVLVAVDLTALPFMGAR